MLLGISTLQHCQSKMGEELCTVAANGIVSEEEEVKCLDMCMTGVPL